MQNLKSIYRKHHGQAKVNMHVAYMISNLSNKKAGSVPAGIRDMLIMSSTHPNCVRFWRTAINILRNLYRAGDVASFKYVP